MMSRVNRPRVPVSVCIPTKDRPDDLRRCIESILSQASLPEEIIVIDDGHLNERPFRELVEAHTNFKYFKKDRPSTAASKNLTKTLASCDFILILDDDTVLTENFLDAVMAVFNRDENGEIGIVCGVVINRHHKTLFEKALRRFFLQDNGQHGRILPWAFQTGFDGLNRETFVDWVSCGTSCFRKRVLQEFAFRESQGGRTALEDVEFGWRVSRKYKLLITPAAKLYHFHSPAGREGLMDTGFKQTYNRCRIFDEHGEVNAKNLTCFIWAMVGYVLGMMGKRRYGLAIGNVKGIICFLKDKIFLRQRT